MNSTFRNVLIVFLLFLLITIPSFLLYNEYSNTNTVIQDTVKSYGPLGPLILIFFVALQVVVALLPGQIVGVVAGYIYGPYLGLLYSVIGLLIGTTIVFYISKKYGRYLIEKMFSKKIITKFDSILGNNVEISLFVIYLLPALPDDFITYLAGLTRISLPRLLLISVIGRLPGFIILNFVGAGLAVNTIAAIVTITLVIFVGLVFITFKEQIETIMHNIVKRV